VCHVIAANEACRSSELLLAVRGLSPDTVFSTDGNAIFFYGERPNLARRRTHFDRATFRYAGLVGCPFVNQVAAWDRHDV
jgi:hypothetical protein